MSDDALFELLGDPADDVLKTADISPDGLYRYTLNRIWGDHRRLLPWIMLNPSTADHSIDDPTIRRCMSFARRWGYGGIRVANLYAFRATDPRQLWEQPDPVGPRNHKVLAELLEEAARHNLPVIAAWGNNAKAERVEQLQRLWYSDHLHAIGVTKDGTPKHPLARGKHRIPDDAQPFPWPVGVSS